MSPDSKPRGTFDVGRIAASLQRRAFGRLGGDRAMLSPLTASAQVLDPERLVDLYRRESSLCRRDRQLLIPVRRVAHDIQAWNICRLVISGHHRTLRSELAAQEPCEIRSLLLSGREEERRAFQRRASFELDAVELTAATDQPADRLLTNHDPVAFASCPRGAAERLAIVTRTTCRYTRKDQAGSTHSYPDRMR